MTLTENIEVNRKIMKLIESKYPDAFPTGYTDPDFRYYRHLQSDVEQAEKYLARTASR